MRRAHLVLRWMERLLVAGGLAVLTWCTYVYIDAHISQRRALDTLEQRRVAGSHQPPAAAEAPAVSSIVAAGAPLATLSIPRLHLSAVVFEGSDHRTLRHGPGHIEHTARPGESGNIGIAGHRDTFFRPLRQAQVGDEILLDTPDARWRYQVTSVRIVSPHEMQVLDPTAEPTLTLVTCYPFWFVGNAPMRFVVHATAAGVDERVMP